MRKYEKADLIPSVEIAKDVEKRIKKTGIKGLDFDTAREAGVFQRISLLLCAMHASIVAAYRIFGAADSIVADVRCKRMEISQTMRRFENEYDKFQRFWTDFYSEDVSNIDVNRDTEVLYRNIMKWAQLPEDWHLWDKQRLDDDSDAVITVDCGDGDNVVNFFRSETDDEVENLEESWCVTKYDTLRCQQFVVEENMDKASAQMVAKRLSSDDSANLYVASLVQHISKKETNITPFSVYRWNQTVGKIKNYLK